MAPSSPVYWTAADLGDRGLLSRRRPQARGGERHRESACIAESLRLSMEAKMPNFETHLNMYRTPLG